MRRPHLPRLANRWRIIGWILVVVFTIVTVAGTASVMLVKQRFVNETDGDLRAEMNGALEVLDRLGSDLLMQVAELAPEALGRSRYAIVLLEPEGPIYELAASRGDRVLPLPDLSGFTFTELRSRAGEPFETAAVDGNHQYRVLTGQFDDGKVLVIAASLDDLERAVHVVVGALLLVALVTAAVLAVVITLVTTRLTRPLEAMIETAEGIGSGALHTRVARSEVDDVDRLAGALNSMLERLELAFAERDRSETKLRRFVSDASHELRTPLAAIIGYVDLYRAAGPAADSALADRALGRIGAEAERMRQLVEELLMLARLDQTRPNDRHPVDLAELAAEAVADATAIDPRRPIELVLPRAGEAVVPGDRTSLRQALDNLLGNTREHTPPDTHVTVTLTAEPSHVRVVVADDGPGIAPDDLPHVFERFYRADPARARSGGAGLGLAIVAAIVEHHGGAIAVVSEPGQGTTFTLTLPGPPRDATP